VGWGWNYEMLISYRVKLMHFIAFTVFCSFWIERLTLRKDLTDRKLQFLIIIKLYHASTQKTLIYHDVIDYWFLMALNEYTNFLSKGSLLMGFLCRVDIWLTRFLRKYGAFVCSYMWAYPVIYNIDYYLFHNYASDSSKLLWRVWRNCAVNQTRCQDNVRIKRSENCKKNIKTKSAI